jgi:putative ABC transport system permease protein
MLRNYIKTALRNLWKNKGFSAINIFGLATGIATCLVIMLYVLDELGYDKYNVHAAQIYRIDNQIKFGDNYADGAQAPPIMGPVFAKDYPQIENYVRFRDQGGFTVRKNGEKLTEDKVIYADSSLFSVFTLPFLAGDPKTALKEPRSLVLTETAAKRYFNGTDAVGKTLVVNDSVYKVTGVIKDIPRQSIFNYDFFLSMSEIKDSREDNWLSENYPTFFLIKPGTDIKQLETRLNKSFEDYTAPELKSILNLTMADFKKGGGYLSCSLMPLLQIHLHSNKQGEMGINGSIQYVYIFAAIAIFILLIACVNFMNLSTARSANRAKEVGVRKVLGSLKKNLIAQFLTESILVSCLAFVVAFGLTLIMVPLFNMLAQKQISGLALFSPLMLVSVFLLMVITGLLAGSYPAFFLSSFQPVEVLKGRLSRGFKGSMLRNALVVFQFAISVVLIVGTVVIYNQLTYIRHKDLGFTKDHILVIKNTYALDKSSQSFNNDLLKMPAVKSTTYTGFLPVTGWRNNDAIFTDLNFDIKKAVSAQTWEVDENYIPTMQMQLKVGRNFSKQFLSDSTAVIVNEAALKFLHTNNPLNGKLYELNDIKSKTFSTYNIIGVVKNFNFNSLKEEVTPLLFRLRQNLGSMAVRINTDDIPGLLAQMKAKWKTLVPSQAFSYYFMDEEFNKQYEAEQHTGMIAITFSALAILVACLGLFGLVTYAAEQRIKEIGIRKVLGANVGGIIGLLSKDFIKLVLISILIASPLAWLVMTQWLQTFAYRINISLWVFLAAGAAALFIALATVSFQAVRAALMNPVKSLRTE